MADELRLTIRLHGRTPSTSALNEVAAPERTDARLLARVIRETDEAVRRADRDQLLRVFRDLDLDSKMIERALQQLRRERRSGVVVVGSRKGSFVLEAVVAATSYWILDKTFGKTLQDAWVRSPMHKRIVDWLSNDVATYRTTLSDLLSKMRFGRPAGMQIVQEDDGKMIVDVTDFLEDEDAPPLKLPASAERPTTT